MTSREPSYGKSPLRLGLNIALFPTPDWTPRPGAFVSLGPGVDHAR